LGDGGEKEEATGTSRMETTACLKHGWTCFIEIQTVLNAEVEGNFGARKAANSRFRERRRGPRWFNGRKNGPGQVQGRALGEKTRSRSFTQILEGSSGTPSGNVQKEGIRQRRQTTCYGEAAPRGSFKRIAPPPQTLPKGGGDSKAKGRGMSVRKGR